MRRFLSHTSVIVSSLLLVATAIMSLRSYHAADSAAWDCVRNTGGQYAQTYYGISSSQGQIWLKFTPSHPVVISRLETEDFKLLSHGQIITAHHNDYSPAYAHFVCQSSPRPRRTDAEVSHTLAGFAFFQPWGDESGYWLAFPYWFIAALAAVLPLRWANRRVRDPIPQTRSASVPA